MHKPLPTIHTGAIARASRSIRLQLGALIVVFLLLPILLYSVFEAADRDRQRLLLEAVQTSGAMVGKALQPILANLRTGDFDRLQGELARFQAERQSIKLLYKPSRAAEAGFFYVASVPIVPLTAMQQERAFLESIGVLARLAQSCTGDIPLSARVAGQGESGRSELLTSVTPVQSPEGCWAVVVALDESAIGGLVDGRPYWMRPEARWAGLVYAGMAALAFAIFAAVWSNLRRFKGVAAAIEKGISFEKATTVPELADIGREFDAMVHRLTRVADLIRKAAEDNAHAFKGPIAVIRQALELVRPNAPGTDAETGMAAIGTSLERLEGLVQSARRIDSATAELLEMGRSHVDLTSLVRALAADYGTMLAGAHSGRHLKLVVEAAEGVAIDGRADQIETILENLVENAVSFSPDGARILVQLKVETKGSERAAVLVVADQGPGVHPDHLEAIFERYYSSRPGQDKTGGNGSHFGIGLWLVKQHAIALNGSVVAEDRPDGGLAVTVRLPCA